MSRLDGGEESVGFEVEDLERMRGAFARHIFPGTREVHVDDLPALLNHLGYYILSEEHVRTICVDLAFLNTLTFEELLDFMTRYVVMEKAELKGAFQTCDMDGSGNISVDELEPLFAYLGITPLRQALLESLYMVDTDLSGDIDADEFLDLIALLRATEGFCSGEVKRLRRVFDRFAKPDADGDHTEMLSSKLVDALTQMFGPQSRELLIKLTQGAAKKPMHTNRKYVTKRLDMKVPLKFQDFLVWARCYREVELAECQDKFRSFDTDQSGRIDREELEQMLHSLGYTPLQKDIDGLLLEVTGQVTVHMDFDGFLRLMDIFHLHDGFTCKEVLNYEAQFIKFHEGANEEMTCLELLNLLRHLGFAPKLSEVHKFIDQVDFDASQTIDFREFLRLMRVQCDDELKRARQSFQVFAAHGQRLHSDNLRAAMLATDVRWNRLPRATFEHFLRERNHPEYMSFDDFADIIQCGRAILAKDMGQQAGFSAKELDEFKHLFATYDVDKNGTIERSELVNLLLDLQIPMRNISDQQSMIEMLRTAHQAARDAGLESDDNQDLGSRPRVTFWMFVYFLRMLYNKDDKKEVEEEDQAIQETGFSSQEVSDFRDIYGHWVKVEETTCPSSRRSTKKNKTSDEAGVAEEPRTLSVDGMSRLFRSLKLSVSPPQMEKLEDVVCKLNSKGNGELNFPIFLRVMKWLVVTDFAGINSKVKQYVGGQVDEPAEPSSHK
jgi:Ca2+-binding EF-hand superfamily protein